MAPAAKPEKRRRPRRSAGCEACKARRMKCTQEKPACKECEKRGMASACVYGTDLVIFQSENSKIESQYRVTGTKRRYHATSGEGGQGHTAGRQGDGWPQVVIKKLKCKVETPETMSNNTSGPASPTMTEASTPAVDIEMESPAASSPSSTLVRKQYLCDDEILPGKGYSSWTTTPHFHLASLEESALAYFFNDFLPSEKFIQGWQPWSRKLKTLMHENDMVRNVILAIARRHVKDTHAIDSATARTNKVLATQNYHQSVCALQDSIEDPVRVRNDITLIAVNLLAVFELMCGNSASFQYHLDGCVQLLKLRGPEGFQKDTELLTLLTFGAFQADQIRLALMNGHTTFLAEPAWQAAAMRCLQPVLTNRFAGTHLNILMLQLTEVCARDRLDLAAAQHLENAFLQERAATLPVANVVSAQTLEQVSATSRTMNLSASPFGQDCICYDPLFGGVYTECVRALTIDWALLCLHTAYPALATEAGDYKIMEEIMQVAQYIFHDRRNQCLATIAECYQPMSLCLEFARSDVEIDWILHFLNHTGVSVANKLGRVAKERIRDYGDAPTQSTRGAQIYGKFLEGAGMTTPAIEAAAMLEAAQEQFVEEGGHVHASLGGMGGGEMADAFPIPIAPAMAMDTGALQTTQQGLYPGQGMSAVHNL